MLSGWLRRVPPMHVVKVAEPQPGAPRAQLVDEQGEPVTEANGFLRLLAVRGYSPNTVRAYAHDLQKLFAFLDVRGLLVGEFTPARAVEFLQWLRLDSSGRRAQRLELGVAAGDGRLLSAKTCNRVMAAVSSFYEYLIASELYDGRRTRSSRWPTGPLLVLLGGTSPRWTTRAGSALSARCCG